MIPSVQVSKQFNCVLQQFNNHIKEIYQSSLQYSYHKTPISYNDFASKSSQVKSCGIPKNSLYAATPAAKFKFSNQMKEIYLSDLACCPNGYKLLQRGLSIKLRKFEYSNAQCMEIGDKYIKYVGGGYSLYRARGKWILQNGENWAEHEGEECCPRNEGAMINFPPSKDGESPHGKIECA